jgi:hypothetical protein
MPEALTNTPRILNMLVDPVTAASVEGAISILSISEGWDVIPAQGGTSELLRWRGSIDLGGLEREALTFFMQNAQVTESGFPSGLGLSGMQIVDVFSKAEITDDDLNLETRTSAMYCPGYNDSVQDMDQILWARIRGFYHDAGWTSDNLQQQFYQQIWGEGIATSASRIHLTRYVQLSNLEDYGAIPGACFQCVGTAVEEPDLNYIMRLRRDYELQQMS